MTTDEQLQILLKELLSPKRAKNDAGEVESRDLSDVLKALKYIGALRSSENPFSGIQQASIEKRDGWR